MNLDIVFLKSTKIDLRAKKKLIIPCVIPLSTF